jgi:enoyl-[acyl-carrier protein] reductase II
MLAAMALGADGVQVGSRFIATPESSAHQNFKDFILKSKEGDQTQTYSFKIFSCIFRNDR